MQPHTHTCLLRSIASLKHTHTHTHTHTHSDTTANTLENRVEVGSTIAGPWMVISAKANITAPLDTRTTVAINETSVTISVSARTLPHSHTHTQSQPHHHGYSFYWMESLVSISDPVLCMHYPEWGVACATKCMHHAWIPRAFLSVHLFSRA